MNNEYAAYMSIKVRLDYVPLVVAQLEASEITAPMARDLERAYHQATNGVFTIEKTICGAVMRKFQHPHQSYKETVSDLIMLCDSLDEDSSIGYQIVKVE